MSTLDDWIADAENTLELPPGSLPKDLRDDLLDLTRDVAHGVARVAAPLTCYLAGLAVARGDNPATVVTTLRDLVPAQPPPDTDAAGTQDAPAPDQPASGMQISDLPAPDQSIPAPDSGPAEETGLGRS